MDVRLGPTCQGGEERNGHRTSEDQAGAQWLLCREGSGFEPHGDAGRAGHGLGDMHRDLPLPERGFQNLLEEERGQKVKAPPS